MSKLIARYLGLALLLLAVAGAARAEMVTDMYGADVPVADQSSAELTRASRLALSEVLVKISGSDGVLRNPVINQALGGARGRVQQFSYGQVAGSGGSVGLQARLEFDEAYINALVREAGVPIWTANRPPALVWLVVEDAGGRRFVNPDSAPELMPALRAEFARRGVPLQLPLYDVADAAALSPEQLWQLDTAALVAASGRYNVQDVLAGRLSLLANGGVKGDWTYLQGGKQITRPANSESEALFIRDGAALVAESMAARYAVAASAPAGGGLSMVVSGVNGYADYAAVVAWLESIELIERANVQSVQGDAITLSLVAQADAAQLAAIIALERRLVPVADAATAGQLHYQWQK